MIFENEINYILDTGFASVIKQIVRVFENDFKKAPGSVHGHHPEDEREQGGIIKHCQRVAWMCVEMCREHALSGAWHDAMLGAALFHDLGRMIPYIKEGESTPDYHGKGHGVKSVVFVQRAMQRISLKITDIVVEQYLLEMFKLMESHMSHWDKEAPKPRSITEALFATCDYFASREELSVPFLKKV